MSKRGFTLLELMIVIAIISILASIAIPAYGAYVGRARMTEVLTMMSEAKLAVVEAASDRASGVAGLTQADTNFLFPAGGVHNTASIVIQAGGIVVGTSQGTGVSPAECIFTLNPLQTDPSQSIAWTCEHTGCAQRFVPSSCL